MPNLLWKSDLPSALGLLTRSASVHGSYLCYEILAAKSMVGAVADRPDERRDRLGDPSSRLAHHTSGTRYSDCVRPDQLFHLPLGPDLHSTFNVATSSRRHRDSCSSSGMRQLAARRWLPWRWSFDHEMDMATHSRTTIR